MLSRDVIAVTKWRFNAVHEPAYPTLTVIGYQLSKLLILFAYLWMLQQFVELLRKTSTAFQKFPIVCMIGP